MHSRRDVVVTTGYVHRAPARYRGDPDAANPTSRHRPLAYADVASAPSRRAIGRAGQLSGLGLVGQPNLPVSVATQVPLPGSSTRDENVPSASTSVILSTCPSWSESV